MKCILTISKAPGIQDSHAVINRHSPSYIHPENSSFPQQVQAALARCHTGRKDLIFILDYQKAEIIFIMFSLILFFISKRLLHVTPDLPEVHKTIFNFEAGSQGLRGIYSSHIIITK